MARSKKNRTMALSPDTSPKELWILVVDYPDEVLSNPALPLIALESPALFANIKQSAEEIKQERWLMRHLKEATPAERRLFAAYCAELVLPFFEEVFPDDTRIRRAIEIARLYAAGESTRQEMQRAQRGVRAARKEARGSIGEQWKEVHFSMVAAKAALEAVRLRPGWVDLGRTAMQAATFRAHMTRFFSHPKSQNPIDAPINAGREMRKRQVEWFQALVASRRRSPVEQRSLK